MLHIIAPTLTGCPQVNACENVLSDNIEFLSADNVAMEESKTDEVCFQLSKLR